jgi:photosystem II stability/assembly factor-like uncharacterized protein
MLYIGTDDGIYRWRPGMPWPIFHSLQGRGIVDLASPGGGVLVAVDNLGRIWETIDNGQEWREVAPPEGAGRPTAVALARSPAVLLLATRPFGLWRRPVGPDPSARLGVLERADRQVTALFDRAVRLARRGRVDGGTAIAEPPKRSSAVGWTPMALPAVESGPIAPAIRALVPGEGAWFAAVAGAGLWRSSDGGASWARCEGLPAEVYAIRTAAKPAGTVAVATADGCRVSGDGGQTWQDRSGGLDGTRHLRALEIKPGNANYLLAGAAPTGPGEAKVAPRGGLRFALYESKDGGKGWSHVVRGFPDVLEYDTIADIRFDPEDPDYAVVALASGELWNTRSDGLWWEPLARQINTARVLCAVG